ncbi:MAG: acyl-CoA thioesterase [Syntrophomonadaceae bacterium]|nr:acyl-CoA thioesterase [Syntrophomonadaceae bacterium]
MLMKHKYCLKVKNYDIDSYGHVNSANYLRYFEDARTAFLEEMGITIKDLLIQGITIFLADISVQFKKQAFLGDQLDIYGWYEEVKRVKLRWRQEIFNNQTKELIAVARTSGAFLKDGKIIPIPSPIREKMLTYAENKETSL